MDDFQAPREAGQRHLNGASFQLIGIDTGDGPEEVDFLVALVLHREAQFRRLRRGITWVNLVQLPAAAAPVEGLSQYFRCAHGADEINVGTDPARELIGWQYVVDLAPEGKGLASDQHRILA